MAQLYECLTTLKAFVMQRKRMKSDKVFNLAVLGVYRYIGAAASKDWHHFDIVVSDGYRKMKCLLSSNCNKFIKLGELLPGCIISVNLHHCTLHHNEISLAAESFVIINNFQLVGLCSPEVANVNVKNMLCLVPYVDKEQDDASPLLFGQGCYLSLWTDDPYLNSTDEMQLAEKNLPTGSLDGVGSLQQLNEKWKVLPHWPPLIVRVLCKSHINNYAKPEKIGKWPFQAYLEVADATYRCIIVLWTSVCVRFFKSIFEGSVLLIHKYKVKPRFQLLSLPSTRYSALPLCDIELSLDSRNPQAEITLVSPEAYHGLKLPLSAFLFVPRYQLSFCPDKFNCDITGMVVKLFRYQRQLDNNDSQLKIYHLYRWLHIYDETSLQPLYVKLYDTSQLEVHNQLKPGSLVVLTQMKLTHNVINSKRSILFVTSTKCTQVTILNQAENCDSRAGRIYCHHPCVARLLDWSNSDNGRNLLQKESAVGGQFVYPPLTNCFQEFAESSPTLFPLASLLLEIEAMVFREIRQISMQCFLLHVAFYPHHSLNNIQSCGITTRRNCNSRGLQQIEKVIRNPTCSDKTEMIGTHLPSPDIVLRKTTDETVQLAMQYLQMPPSNQIQPPTIMKQFADLPAFDTVGYLIMTFTGLNENIHTPNITCIWPVPTILSSLTLSDVLSGKETSDSHHSLDKRNLHNLLDSSLELANRRLLCTLTLYPNRANGKHLEIILNRAFVVNKTD